MNIPRYMGRRIKSGAGRLFKSAVFILQIVIGVAIGILIAAPFV